MGEVGIGPHSSNGRRRSPSSSTRRARSGAAALHDAPVDEHVDMRRLQVLEQSLVVGDHQEAALVRRHPGDPFRHRLEGVDVEPRVGLVEDGEHGFEDGQLQDLVALALPAGEPLVEVAVGERRVHPEAAHGIHHLEPQFEHRVVDPGAVGEGGAQEVDHRDARDLLGVLEAEEHPRPAPLVRLPLGDVLAVEHDGAGGDPVRRVAHEDGRQGALPRPVGAHQRVDLAAVDHQVESLDDLGVLHRHVEARRWTSSGEPPCPGFYDRRVRRPPGARPCRSSGSDRAAAPRASRAFSRSMSVSGSNCCRYTRPSPSAAIGGESASATSSTVPYGVPRSSSLARSCSRSVAAPGQPCRRAGPRTRARPDPDQGAHHRREGHGIRVAPGGLAAARTAAATRARTVSGSAPNRLSSSAIPSGEARGCAGARNRR